MNWIYEGVKYSRKAMNDINNIKSGQALFKVVLVSGKITYKLGRFKSEFDDNFLTVETVVTLNNGSEIIKWCVIIDK